MPLLYPSVRFDHDPLGQMPPPAHEVVNRHFSHIGIANASFTRSDPVGAEHTHHTHTNNNHQQTQTAARIGLRRCLKKHCHVVICERRIRCFATWSELCSHWFPPCIGETFTLVLLSLCDLPLCNNNTFSDRRLSLSRTIRSLPSLFILTLALRLHTDLRWHKIASVLFVVFS